MRLFLAIEVDEAVRAAAAAVQRHVAVALGSEASALRMVRPAQLHLTLVFLGEVSDDRVPTMMAALEAPLDAAPYTLTFGGIGVFPAHGAPRVLWVGVVRGAAETVAVHGAVLARLIRLAAASGTDVNADERTFTPHLTIGRWRDGRPRHRRALQRVEVAEMRSRVDAVTLFQSQLGPAGATHTALVRTRLGGL